MSGVLVLAETRRGALREISLEAITAAHEIKEFAEDRLVVAVMDSNPESFADQLDREGVDELVLITTPTEHFEAHLAERALEELMAYEEPSVVIAGFTVNSMAFIPAVAAKNRLGLASDVFSVSGSAEGVVARRGAYGDKLVAEVDFPDKSCALLMIRPGAFDVAEVPGRAERRRASLDADAGPTEHLEFRASPDDAVDITKASFLLAVGRGIEEQESLPQFEELAEKIGATLAVSRPLVDAGWVSNARQVGQSGKTVKPTVYLALGISGAVQHLAGMQQAQTIIAVNTDPSAPIFGVADYGVVADLFEIADELAHHFE